MVPYSEESIGHLRENSSLWEEIWKLTYNILLRTSISHTTDYDHKMIADHTKMRFQKKFFWKQYIKSNPSDDYEYYRIATWICGINLTLGKSTCVFRTVYIELIELCFCHGIQTCFCHLHKSEITSRFKVLLVTFYSVLIRHHDLSDL